MDTVKRIEGLLGLASENESAATNCLHEMKSAVDDAEAQLKNLDKNDPKYAELEESIKDWKESGIYKSY